MATKAATTKAKGACLARMAWRFALVALVAGGLLAPVATAGTISLSWNPVGASDLKGYRVKYGTDPNDLDQVQEVTRDASSTDGPVPTSVELSGLADCTVWYATVHAFDNDDLESVNPSNTVKGLPRPQISSVVPGSVKAGETVEFTVTGFNFDQGDASDPNHPPTEVKLLPEGLGVDVQSVTIDNCRTLRVQVKASEDAAIRDFELEVRNADLTFSAPAGKPKVFQRLAAAISVRPADETGPTVVSTTPAAGAGGVASEVRPTVSFSEPIDPTTVSAATVRLLDEQGGAVAQAAGSPQVAGELVTIFPASPLDHEKAYRVEAKGGSSGVHDLAGNAMDSDFVQNPGFVIVVSDDETPRIREEGPHVVSSWPYPGQQDVVPSLDEVRVTFDRDMTPLFEGLSREELARRFTVTSGRTLLPQTATSPRIEGNGETVVIELAAALQQGQAYTTTVQLAGATIGSELSGLGLSDFEMEQIWTTRPAWRVAGGLVSASYRDPDAGGATELTDGGPSLDESNSNVPVSSEFVLTFDEPVAESSRTAGVFRLLVQSGRRYTAVELVEPLIVEDGGATIVLRPAEPLPAGTQVLIDVRTGAQGVILEGPDGAYSLGGGSPIQLLFVTEVSGASLDAGLAVGE